MLDVEVHSDLDELGELLPQWDRLVVAGERPRSAPALVMPWYRHLAAPWTSPRVLTAWEGSELVGVLPMTLFKRRFNLARYEIAGSAVLNAVEPAGAPGREAEVAGAFARALQRTSPVPDTLRFGWMERTSPWSDAMWRAWVGTRPNLQSLDACPGLRVSLDDGGYQGWLARRDKRLAHGVRRRQRRIAEEGFVIATHDDAAGITARLPEVVLQYNSRRQARQDGGAVFDERVLEMLHESVIALSDQGRVWLTTIERDGECMGVGLSVAAGKVATGWIAGFDETWSRFAPGICTLFASIEFAASRGYAEYDLGIGGQAHKYGIADREVTLELVELERRGMWPLQSPFQLVPLRWRPALIAGVDRCLTQAGTLRKRTESGSPG